MKILIRNKAAQSTIEFTFCMVIISLLLYGCVMFLRWAGMTFAERRMKHDTTLTTGVADDWGSYEDSALKQLKGDFYTPGNMGLVFNKW